MRWSGEDTGKAGRDGRPPRKPAPDPRGQRREREGTLGGSIWKAEQCNKDLSVGKAVRESSS